MNVMFSDRSRVGTPTIGTGTLELASPFVGMQGFVVPDGSQVSYTIEDGLVAWEVGYGTYTKGVGNNPDTLSRDTVESSSSNGALINLSGLASVFITPAAGWLNTLISTGAIVSDTPPAFSRSGMLWWDSVGGELYIGFADADSQQWVAASSAAGYYLPITGGTVDGDLTVAGNLSANVVATGGTAPRLLQDRFRDLRTPFDWGAVGDGTTDDTAALQAMFTQLGTEGGGRVYIPGTFRAVGALTVPANVEIYGDFSTAYAATSYFQAHSSRLILGTSGITLGKSNILRNIMVISDALPRTNPTTNAAAAALVASMASNGTGVTLGGDNCLVDTVQVLGFNYGIYGSGDPGDDRQMLRNVHGDNTNCIWLASGGDTCRIQGGHFWPYLSANISNTPTDLTRPGYGIYLGNVNCDTPVDQVTVYGWLHCFMVSGTSGTFTECWADGTGALGTTGFATTGACQVTRMANCIAVANQFGVHHSPSNGAVLSISGGCAIQGGGVGGSTPATGMSLCVYADGYGPVQSIGADYTGGDAAFWLGPNSGPSIIIGNTFDDAGGNWGYIWNVDPAVLPALTKHSNRVINSTRGLTEQNPTGPVTVYDTLPNQTNFPSLTSQGIKITSTTTQTGSLGFLTTGNGTDQNVWDEFAGGGNLVFRAVNDANTAATTWLAVSRSGYVPQAITLTAPTITLTGQLVNDLDGNFATAGAVTAQLQTKTSGGDAILGLNIAGVAAINLGLDHTGLFRIGGWSWSQNRLTLDSSGNLTLSGGVTAAGNVNLSGALTLSPGASPNPQLWLHSTTGGANQKYWEFQTDAASTGSLAGYAWNDAQSAFTQWLGVTRTGYVPQQITLTAPTISLAGSVSVAGGLTVNGNIVAECGAGSNFYLSQSGQIADQNLWRFYAGGGGGGSLVFDAVNDAVSASTTWLTVTRTGYVPQNITLTAPTITHAGATAIGAGGPTVTSGAAAPASTQPVSSLYLRTGGAAGARLYVSAGGGTWTAVAGV